MTEHLVKVLFVDDEPRVLDGLRRQLRPHRNRWEMRFAHSGKEALQTLSEWRADVVVSDMRMPGMSGCELLTAVRELYPETFRIVLSGQTDSQELMTQLDPIHQFFQKPCDPTALYQSIEQMTGLIRALSAPNLQRVASHLSSLPVLDQSYRELVALLGDEDTGAGQVAEVLRRDVGLSAKILQLVNSAFFGLPRHVVDVREAVKLLGLTTIKLVVLSAKVFERATAGAMAERAIQAIWAGSQRLGATASGLAQSAGAPQVLADRCYLAGSLSRVGRAILIVADRECHEQTRALCQEQGLSASEAEAQVFGATQAGIGAYLLGLWGFDEQVIEAVAHQHDPTESGLCERDRPLAYLHLACCRHPHADGFDDPAVPATDWLAGAGLDHLAEEQQSSVT